MLRYFFDIHDGQSIRDAVGIDLADEAAARSHAMMVASAYANDPTMLSTDGGVIVVEVREATAKLLTVRLVFSVTPE